MCCYSLMQGLLAKAELTKCVELAYKSSNTVLVCTMNRCKRIESERRQIYNKAIRIDVVVILS